MALPVLIRTVYGQECGSGWGSKCEKPLPELFLYGFLWASFALSTFNVLIAAITGQTLVSCIYVMYFKKD